MPGRSMKRSRAIAQTAATEYYPTINPPPWGAGPFELITPL